MCVCDNLCVKELCVKSFVDVCALVCLCVCVRVCERLCVSVCLPVCKNKNPTQRCGNPAALARDTVAGEALRRFSTCARVNSLNPSYGWAIGLLP